MVFLFIEAVCLLLDEMPNDMLDGVLLQPPNAAERFIVPLEFKELLDYFDYGRCRSILTHALCPLSPLFDFLADLIRNALFIECFGVLLSDFRKFFSVLLVYPFLS